jgi:hypothetical protein
LFRLAHKKSRPVCVRFSRRLSDQCAGPRSRTLERRVCDAVANGEAQVTGRRGPGGRPLIRFERRPPQTGAGGAAVIVLAERQPGGWLALRLLAPRAFRDKFRDGSDF